MRFSYGKPLLLTLLSVCCTTSIFAANAPASAQTSGVTNAIAFGVQAGQVAGSAQGCGLDVATFTSRVGEAINKLALNPTDNQAALSSYQQTLQQAQIVQRNNNPIPCSQVKQDFNNLPLMRPDYQQSVIAQLSPSMTGEQSQTGGSSTQQNTATASNQPAPAAGGAASSTQTKKLPSNPAYPKQDYGPMKSFSTNFPGAVKPYGMANMPQQQATQQMVTAAPTQQNQPQQQTQQAQPAPTTNNTYPNTAGNNNYPQPPSFTNPNNNPPPAANNYPSQ